MAFICDWFVSATVNAVQHERIGRLSLYAVLLPIQSEKDLKASTALHSFSLYLDNWNKYPFETKRVGLIYRQCDFLEATSLRQYVPFINTNNAAELQSQSEARLRA